MKVERWQGDMASICCLEGHSRAAWKVRSCKQKVVGLPKFVQDHPSCYVDGLEGQGCRLGQGLADHCSCPGVV